MAKVKYTGKKWNKIDTGASNNASIQKAIEIEELLFQNYLIVAKTPVKIIQKRLFL